MIDIHCHLLPGLDDGAQSMEQALGIARQLQAAGFQSIIATPHVFEGRDYLNPEKILKAVEELNEHLTLENLDLKIYPGAENYIFPDMAKWVIEGKLMTLGNQGQYLLVELPRLDIPHYTDQVFFELQVAGITPVLAHPERYKRLNEEPSRLIEWVRRGILFQVNLRSLSGHYGPEAQEFARWMQEQELIHFIGSDAHRVGRSMEAYQPELRLLREVSNIEFPEFLMRKNPAKILTGGLMDTKRKEEYPLPKERTPTANPSGIRFKSLTQRLAALFGK